MDTISGSEGHKRNKWSKADFDPVSFQADPNPTLVLPAADSSSVAVTSTSATEGSQFHAAVCAI